MSKKFDDDVMSENCDVIVISGFLVNLEESWGRITDTESVKVMFSVIGSFCFKKTANWAKRSQTQLLHYCFE